MENDTLRFPPGFRFKPTDEELIAHYLNPKIQSIPLRFPFPEAVVCTSDPWSLPGDSQQERYFFSPVETKYPYSKRANRTTPSGHWKPTSLDKKVVDSRNRHVGTKKTFVFYVSEPANRSKTDWYMHEYKLASPIQGMQNWAICRVFMKNKARKDAMQAVNLVEVGNTGSIFCVQRNFDLNKDDGGGSSCSGSSGVTDEDEDEENCK